MKTFLRHNTILIVIKAFRHSHVRVCTGGDSSNKGCFGRKTNLFRESGIFAGNRENWEIFFGKNEIFSGH